MLQVWLYKPAKTSIPRVIGIRDFSPTYRPGVRRVAVLDFRRFLLAVLDFRKLLL